VHLGGDIRGNYSRPYIFQFTEPDYFYDWSQISTGNGEKSFYSEDAGYHWYDNEGGGEVDFARAPLTDLYPIDLSKLEVELAEYSKRMIEAGREPEPQVKRAREQAEGVIDLAIEKSKDMPDIIFYDDEGNGYLEGKQLYPGGVSL